MACSTLPRSLESARALGRENIDVCEDLFREMDMPRGKLSYPRLSPPAWSVIFRLAWMAGYSAQAESFLAARQRVRACAQRLQELAAAHGRVLFVGHGFLNGFIASDLKAMGCSGQKKLPRKYWESATYHASPESLSGRPAL